MFTWPQGSLGVICRRRTFLRAGGGLVAAGFASPLANWLSAAEPAGPATRGTGAPRPGRARSCILVYLLGGPPQLDTFDLKPAAPAEIRGPFRPIATSVPGLEICEHLPRLAARAERYALVRSVSHPNSNHTPMIYYTLTGFATENPAQDNDVRPPLRTDHPHWGAVLARLRPPVGQLPGFVAIPELAVRSSTEGEFKRARQPLRGGGAGFLGAVYDPLAVNGEPGAPGALPALARPSEVTAARLDERATLLAALERGREPSPASAAFAAVREQALVLSGAGGGGTAELFSLANEPEHVRERYGRHRFGNSLLLARRLTEAGVPLVAVHFNEMTRCDGWDTHSHNFAGLESELLPLLDQGLSALLDDLAERGRLDETIVVCQGEFGRTPQINANAGRDHWGHCSTTLLAGGGIRGGQAFGASDRWAAHPASDPVDPVDIQATVYHSLGLDPGQVLRDELGRPHPLTQGRVLTGLL